MREHWGSRLGFLLSAIGSAIGLGVLWKFPYIVGNHGGGLFLLMYVVAIIVIGIPVLIGELHLGRVAGLSSIGAFSSLSEGKRNWKIAGYLSCLSSFLIMSFYSVIAGWGMSYILISISTTYQTLSPEKISSLFVTLSESGSITLFWHFSFTAITAAIVISGVRKGIEFWSKIMTRLLILLLVLLFLYSITLEGFEKAWQFIFQIHWSTFSFSHALEALGLAFFTLSLGQGIMISYGSYMRKEENIPQLAIIISSAVLLVSLLAALTIFPVIFTFGFAPEEGEGLIFKTLPFLFAKIPGGNLLATMFFILFVFTALTSSIPFIEVLTTNLMERKHYSRKKAALLSAAAAALFGIPSALSIPKTIFPHWDLVYGKTFLQTIDQFVSVWIIPLCGLLTAIFVGWVVKKEWLMKAFPQKKGWKTAYKFWYLLIRWVIPLLIIGIILQKSALL